MTRWLDPAGISGATGSTINTASSLVATLAFILVMTTPTWLPSDATTTVVTTDGIASLPSTTFSTNTSSTEPIVNESADGSFLESVTTRGIFGRDSTESGLDALVEVGFNTVIVTGGHEDLPSKLDDIHALGLDAVVWLGEYDRTSPCEFEFSDNEIEDLVNAVANNPVVVAYFIADEPTYAFAADCPEAVQDITDRSNLVKSLDPRVPTMVTLTTWDGREPFPYHHWTGSADIFGLVSYPCFQGACNFGIVEDSIKKAEAAGLSEYWAVIQDFSDAWYDLPTASEVDKQFRVWASSNMTGYLVFAAEGFECCGPSDFETNPNKAEVLDAWNRSGHSP